MKIKKNFILWSIMGGIILSILGYVCNYFWKRTISFDYVTSVPKVNGLYPHGIHYAKDKETMYHMLCNAENPYHYDSIYISKYIEQLDYVEYDYIISSMRKVISLNYSPYLSASYDGAPSLPLTPLIPKYDEHIVDSIFIYRIKANDTFRHPAP